MSTPFNTNTTFDTNEDNLSNEDNNVTHNEDNNVIHNEETNLKHSNKRIHFLKCFMYGVTKLYIIFFLTNVICKSHSCIYRQIKLLL